MFWGVRGGGGSFGIVTEFEFSLDPLGPIVLAGPIIWPIEDSPKVLRFCVTARDAEHELPVECASAAAPPRLLQVPRLALPPLLVELEATAAV